MINLEYEIIENGYKLFAGKLNKDISIFIYIENEVISYGFDMLPNERLPINKFSKDFIEKRLKYFSQNELLRDIIKKSKLKGEEDG